MFCRKQNITWVSESVNIMSRFYSSDESSQWSTSHTAPVWFSHSMTMMTIMDTIMFTLFMDHCVRSFEDQCSRVPRCSTSRSLSLVRSSLKSIFSFFLFLFSRSFLCLYNVISTEYCVHSVSKYACIYVYFYTSYINTSPVQDLHRYPYLARVC